MRRVEGGHIATGLLVAAGLVGIWQGGAYRGQANQECDPITTVAPSGQEEWICSDYNAVEDGGVGDFLNDVGFMAFGGAGMLVLIGSLRNPNPNRPRNSRIDSLEQNAEQHS